jgi:Tol biopolymer transport system component
MMEFPTGWTPDGRQVIVASWNYATRQDSISLASIEAAPSAERSQRIITSSASAGVTLGTMSPDGRWVAFRVGELEGFAPRIAVVLASGGDRTGWRFITPGVEPADKPCWSDDGRTLYFVSGKQTMNVWGVRFDSSGGRPVGDPFQVTAFKGPGEHVLSDIQNLALGVGGRRLVVPLVRPKGGLWMLELPPR